MDRLNKYDPFYYYKVKTIYTCITGGWDDLKEPINTPPQAHQGWKFICYTDNPDIKSINRFESLVENNIWEIRPLLFEHANPAKTARWHKINFHRATDTLYSIWVDATFFVNIDLNRWWRRYKQPFTTIQHPFDDCAYTDIASCIGGRKGNRDTIIKQYNDYKNEGLPENYGLIASGILMRQRSKEVIRFCEAWWDQVDKYTERDQPSFTYTMWKNPGIVDSIRWDYTTMDEFIHVPHMHKQKSRGNRFEELKQKTYETTVLP